MFYSCVREYTPAPALIDVIARELLTDQQREILKLKVGALEVSFGEQLMAKFGNMGAIGNLMEAKIRAAELIERNKKNIENIPRLQELIKVVNDPEQYGEGTRTNPETIDVLNQFSGQVTNTRNVSAAGTKTRQGISNSSEEREITDEGNMEDKDLLEQMTQYKIKQVMELQTEKDKEGNLTVGIKKEEDDEAGNLLPLPDEQGQSIHMHSISINQARSVTMGHSTNNVDSVTGRTTQKKGKTETIKMQRAKAITDSLSYQLADLRGRIMNQFGVLFTNVRRCQ